MVRMVTGNQIFEDMLGDINYPLEKYADTYPFKVRVACVKRRPPRHDFFEFIRNMGLEDIDRVLAGKPLRGREVLTFVFPERWMNVVEQQSFMSCLMKNPDIDKIKQVDIVTSSPLLIGNFFSEMIRVVTWEDDKNYEGI